MKTLSLILGTALALFVMTTGDARADHWGCNSRYGYNYAPQSRYYSAPSYGYNNFNRSYYGGHGNLGGSHWHDTSHWDYHPTQIVPHGNHYHVQPGHYDYHQTGHWDRW